MGHVHPFLRRAKSARTEEKARPSKRAMSSRCKSASAAWPDNPAKQLGRAQRATACGVQRNVGSPPHSALVLTLLGPLHTPSDVPELMCMARRLQDAAAIGMRPRLWACWQRTRTMMPCRAKMRMC